MKIDLINIACYRHDLRFTRILVASIRRWYPDIPICLIKDHYYGGFDTGEIERRWRVSVFSPGGTAFGWGFSKLEPLFLPEKKRCLILDSDIVFAGPVLEFLEAADGDFVVQHEDPNPDFVRKLYFDPDRLRGFDPDFKFPGFTFNTGQFVATTGLLRREDFAPHLLWESPRRLAFPDAFAPMGEQGVLNYVLMKKQQLGEISLRRARFMEVPGAEDCPAVRASDMSGPGRHRFVLHWCGKKRPLMRDMPLADVLFFFETEYYRRLPFGLLIKWWRLARAEAAKTTRRLASLLHLKGRPPASP